MSRPNVQIQLRNIGDTMRRLGYGQVSSIVSGLDTNGNDCIRFDFSAANWASGNLTVLIRALGMQVGGIPTSPSWMTPSVAVGQYSNGTYMYEMVIEDVALATNAGGSEKFMSDIIHVLRGVQGNSVNFWKTATGTQPLFGGFNGAVNDVLGTFVGTLLPGSRVAAPGFGS
jgi:hypothetical protein